VVLVAGLVTRLWGRAIGLAPRQLARREDHTPFSDGVDVGKGGRAGVNQPTCGPTAGLRLGFRNPGKELSTWRGYQSFLCELLDS